MSTRCTCPRVTTRAELLQICPTASELRKVTKPPGAIYKSGELISAAGDILSPATALRSQNHRELLRVQLCEPGVPPRRCIYPESPSTDPHPSSQERSWRSRKWHREGFTRRGQPPIPSRPTPSPSPLTKLALRDDRGGSRPAGTEAPGKCNKPAATGKEMGRDGGSPAGTICTSALLLPQFPLPITSPKLQQLAKAASEGTQGFLSSFFVVIFLEMPP